MCAGPGVTWIGDVIGQAVADLLERARLGENSGENDAAGSHQANGSHHQCALGARLVFALKLHQQIQERSLCACSWHLIPDVEMQPTCRQ